MRFNAITGLMLTSVYLFACSPPNKNVPPKEQAIESASRYKRERDPDDLKQAIASQREVYQKTPTVKEAGDLATLLVANGQVDEARALLVKHEKNANSFEDWLILGSTYIGLKDRAGAMNAYNRAFTLATSPKQGALLEQYKVEIRDVQ